MTESDFGNVVDAINQQSMPRSKVRTVADQIAFATGRPIVNEEAAKQIEEVANALIAEAQAEERRRLLPLLESSVHQLNLHASDYHHVTDPVVIANLYGEILRIKGKIPREVGEG